MSRQKWAYRVREIVEFGVLVLLGWFIWNILVVISHTIADE